VRVPVSETAGARLALKVEGMKLETWLPSMVVGE
jgi:hypothetical protein